jgi:glycine dehydrogenase subunit 1
MFISNTKKDTEEMLAVIGKSSVDELIKGEIPQEFLSSGFALPAALDERELSEELKSLAAKNKPLLNFAGAGVYEHFVPAAVNAISSRGEFMTAYTPYQAEASQGTLQAIYEYQSNICNLFDMEVSNASHYDGASALAEAVSACVKISGKNKVVYGAALHPQYKEVLETYFANNKVIKFDKVACPRGTIDVSSLENQLDDAACFVLQTPNFYGCIEDARLISEKVKSKNVLLIAVVNPLSLGVLQTPGEYNADFAVAEGQPIGNAVNFGGPTLGIFTCKKEFSRSVPGRICGIAKDADGKRAFVLTLQAREQHIRRERASSNICSNQALCALNACVYLTLLGPQGLREVCEINLENARVLKEKIERIDGYKIKFDAPFFNEFVVECPKPASRVIKALAKKGVCAGYDMGLISKDFKNCLLVCATETKSLASIDVFATALEQVK